MGTGYHKIQNKNLVWAVLLSTALVLSFQNCAKTGDSGGGDGSSVGALTTCNFDGREIAAGSFVEAYLHSTEPFGMQCHHEIRICNRGALTGSYEYSSCDINVPAACLFDGRTIRDREGVMAFKSSTVAYGSTCESEVRVCNNGVLSGLNEYSSCQVGVPAACLFNGRTVESGSSITAFESSQVPSGQSCKSESRACDNGKLSGSYSKSSCIVASATPTATSTRDASTSTNPLPGSTVTPSVTATPISTTKPDAAPTVVPTASATTQ